MATESRIFSAHLEYFSSKLNPSLEKAISEAVVNSLLSHFGRVKTPSFSWQLQHFFFVFGVAGHLIG